MRPVSLSRSVMRSPKSSANRRTPVSTGSTTDVPLADVIDIVFKAKPFAISFEAANPRHAHEWQLFETVKLPAGTWVGQAAVDPDIVWAKLGALAEGARIASTRFWK